MRIHLLRPEDHDLTGAPSDGTLYLDSRIGHDGNNGLSAATPRRTLNSVPSILRTNDRIYLRNGGYYRRRAAKPKYGDGAGISVTSQGSGASRPAIIGWGAGRPAFIGGDILEDSWGAVTDSYGNMWLASNGQQMVGPKEATIWHPQFVGDCMLTPAYWSPHCPVDLSTVGRWEFFSSTPGAYAWYSPGAAATQGFSATDDAGGVEIQRDMEKAALEDSFTCYLPIATPYDDTHNKHQSTFYVRHPAIAAHYGDGPGPVGAVLAFRGQPANLSYRAYIIAYDPVTSTLTAVTTWYAVSSGGRIRPPLTGVSWRILGHPFDLRQPGQYACVIHRDGTPPTLYRARGDWMRGDSTMARIPRAAHINIVGGELELSSLRFGRQAGSGREYIDIDDAGMFDSSVTCHAVSMRGDYLLADTIWAGEMLPASSGHAAFYSISGSPVDNANITSIGVGRCWTGSGIRGAFARGTLDGVTVEECGRTAVYFTTKADGDTTITDMVGIFSEGVHANLFTIYEGGSDITVDGYSSMDCTRSVTTQAQNPNRRHRDNKIIDMFVLGNLAVSSDPDDDSGAEGTGVYQFRSDSWFMGCEIDGALLADGDGLQLYGTTNGDAKISRSYFSKLRGNKPAGWAGDPTNGEAPVAFTDVASANADETAITGRGATTTRVIQSDEQPWTGAMSEVQWQKLTADGTGGYKAVRLGAQRYDWQIPAYNPASPDPGAPVELQLSKSDYYAKPQPGKAINHVLRARPMSVLSLPAGVDDNDLLALNQGRLMARDVLPARDLVISVQETPRTKSGGTWSEDAGNARVTQFMLRVVH